MGVESYDFNSGNTARGRGRVEFTAKPKHTSLSIDVWNLYG